MSDPVQAFRAAILAALGHAPDDIEPGRFHRFGTSDRRGDDAGWCKLFDDLRGGVFGCYRQGISETWSAADRARLTRQQRADLTRQVAQAAAERERIQRQQWAENAQRIAKLWSECLPLVPGDPVTLYLKRRGFGGLWPLPECLRYHRAQPYWDGAEKLGTFPAMVAPLVAPDGRTVALHRTYLTTDGRKAGVPSPKKLTGATGPLAGACIPLQKPARGVIGIAEGIETAMAAWCASTVPTMAAYCAGNLAAWTWPTGVQRLVIFADHDKAGREAADTLRARALAANLRCDVLTPTTAGVDWCDVWAQRGPLAIDGAAA
ncbi:MAG: toprim domain-containing protein [Burkholderiales bacterium]|nr:toprim domain-containing protein [Burkholderiales bacterium]